MSPEHNAQNNVPYVVFCLFNPRIKSTAHGAISKIYTHDFGWTQAIMHVTGGENCSVLLRYLELTASNLFPRLSAKL